MNMKMDWWVGYCEYKIHKEIIAGHDVITDFRFFNANILNDRKCHTHIAIGYIKLHYIPYIKCLLWYEHPHSFYSPKNLPIFGWYFVCVSHIMRIKVLYWFDHWYYYFKCFLIMLKEYFYFDIKVYHKCISWVYIFGRLVTL